MAIPDIPLFQNSDPVWKKSTDSFFEMPFIGILHTFQCLIVMGFTHTLIGSWPMIPLRLPSTCLSHLVLSVSGVKFGAIHFRIKRTSLCSQSPQMALHHCALEGKSNNRPWQSDSRKGRHSQVWAGDTLWASNLPELFIQMLRSSSREKFRLLFSCRSSVLRRWS